MYIKSAHSCATFAAGALAVCAATLTGNAAAKEFGVQVAIRVDMRGIDVRQPAGAHELYRRLEHAANVACTYGNRVDLKPAENLDGCRDDALGSAVHSVNSPLVTQLYLENHTLRQAAAHGIQVPKQVASK
ncbi:MAG: UrcA family protein [Proteobacteria bacterium]|nr:UrcA family protein [Pseudomonadota bacterium]